MADEFEQLQERVADLESMLEGMNIAGEEAEVVQFVPQGVPWKLTSPQSVDPGHKHTGDAIDSDTATDGQVLTADGNAIMQVSSQNKAKYLVYASRFKLTSVKIPTDEMQLKSVITKYESCLDAIIKEIEADYKKIFPGEKRSNNFVNEIFRILNLNRY